MEEGARKTLVAFAIILALSVGGGKSADAAEPQGCVRNLMRGLFAIKKEQLTKARLAAAKAALGRRLSVRERRTLDGVLDEPHAQKMNAVGIFRQNRLLREGGFSEAEIRTLRKQGFLGAKAAVAKPIPKQVDLLDLQLSSLDKEALRELQGGGVLTYLVDPDHQVWITRSEISLSEDALQVVRNAENQARGGFLVKESGLLHFDDKTQSFRFMPRYGIDPSPQEIRSITENVEAGHPGIKFAREKNPALLESTQLDCLQILTRQQSGGNFIVDRMLADNLTAISAIATSEIAGAGRLSTAEGQGVLMVDLAGANASQLLGGALGKALILSNARFGVAMGARTTAGLGLIQAQKGFYDEVVGDTNYEASNITYFNQAYLIGKLPVDIASDKLIMKKLPLMLWDACRNGSKLRVFVSPRMVRIYERYGSALIYYGVRNWMIGH